MEVIINADKHRQDILDEIRSGTHNIVINAVAGAGKTTTILDGVNLIPSNKSVLFVSFNKSIEMEISYKLKSKIWEDLEDSEKIRIGSIENVDIPITRTVTTCHALGKKIIEEYLQRNLEVEEWKYQARFNEIRQSENYVELSHNEELAYTSNVKKLIEYARFFLCETIYDIEKTAKRYGLNLIDNECEIVLELLEWGKNSLDVIDYTDMIWLPHALNITPKKYRYEVLFIDEAQDLSKAQQELIRRTMLPTSRFVAAGDVNQCINAWDGADPDAFKNYLSYPNTISMGMPVTRRCDKNIVKLAQTFVPQIEALPDADDGIIDFNASPWDPKDDNDIVLCRNNAPLIKYLNHCLEKNIKVRLAGANEFKKDLFEILDSTDEEILALTFNEHGMFPDLYRKLLQDIKTLQHTKKIDQRSAYKAPFVASRIDYIKCLETLALGLTTKTELKNKINDINADRSNKGLTLSTIHRSKGLTFNNCYILGKSLIPSPLAKEDWEIQAEDNLHYVAITRARHKLGYISEDIFPVDNIFSNPEKSIKFLKDIEEKLKILDNIPRGRKTNINRDVSGNTKTVKTRKVGALKFKTIMKK